jgi:hypothetical protein
MISNEASASELAISSAITPAPSRHASADGMNLSAAPLLHAPAPAKGPPRCLEMPAPRSDRMRATDHYFFSTLSGRSGPARILVHVFIIYFYCWQT